MESVDTNAPWVCEAGQGRLDGSWAQGRGAFGGLQAAIVLEAMIREVDDVDRVPRSLSVHFCGPLGVGADAPFAVDAEAVRVGGRVTHAAARIRQAGEVRTMATASFCKRREAAAPARAASRVPVVPAAAALAPMPAIAGVPVFLRHFDVRFLQTDHFAYPFSGASRASIAAWVRLRAPRPLDAPHATALFDVLPPAIVAMADRPKPVVSVDFTLQWFSRFEQAGVADFHLVTADSEWSEDGYAEEVRCLWSPDGALLGRCLHLAALLA